MVDDVDDTFVPGVLELVDFVKTLGSVRDLGTVKGIAVLQRTEMPARQMLEELYQACAAKGIYRPWNLTPLHSNPLPINYARSKSWTDGPRQEFYQLGFLARCGAGAYGFSPGTDEGDLAVLHALSQDRNDGDVIARQPAESGCDILRQYKIRFRVLVVKPEEAATYAPLLLPGGLMISRHRPTPTTRC